MAMGMTHGFAMYARLLEWGDVFPFRLQYNARLHVVIYPHSVFMGIGGFAGCFQPPLLSVLLGIACAIGLGVPPA